MNFKEMIDAGAKKLGTQAKLAEIIGLTETNLASAKAGRRGVPDEGCVTLAELIDMDPFTVIAARNEWMAKTEEAKSFWHRFSQAATIAAAVIGVTLFVSLPSDAVAAQRIQNTDSNSYTLFTLG